MSWGRRIPAVYMDEARAELAYEEARYERECHEAIAAELVACTLGLRDRPELHYLTGPPSARYRA